MTLQNHNTLDLAYQIIPAVHSTPYLATNAAAKPWSAQPDLQDALAAMGGDRSGWTPIRSDTARRAS